MCVISVVIVARQRLIMLYLARAEVMTRSITCDLLMRAAIHRAGICQSMNGAEDIRKSQIALHRAATGSGAKCEPSFLKKAGREAPAPACSYLPGQGRRGFVPHPLPPLNHVTKRGQYARRAI